MLELCDVTKVFHEGTAQRTVALDHLSLHVRPGEFVSVIGTNGAGKSTLLTAVAGEFLPDGGSVRIDGRDVTRMAEHKRAALLGRVFQDPMRGTAPEMSILENLALAARRGKRRTLAPGVNKAETEAYRKKLAALDLGLEGRLTAKVGLLSGGQRQALTLLMATLRTPKLLLLDEHTAALDPKTAKAVLALTGRIVKEQALTALMVTHNMQSAIDCGDRLLMMQGGRIILDISGAEKRALTVDALLRRFEAASGSGFASDRALLGE